MGDNAARTMSDNLMPIIITTPATTNDSETASTSEGDEATFTQGHNDLTAISPKCDNKVTSPNDSTSSNVGGAEVKGSDATKHRLHMLKADNTQMAVHAASLPEGLAGHSLDTTIPDG
ncbi:hypothetical protein SARC_12492 [Sphaeroforma arctica JP610]|uniref:Uncharacterized protein n=1 Tax=Sphaeroforma arctica JP610 TaxID=667725 RepID=A0A0L0FFZ7_9EUKA|nr:hypothetical protein SARC_12492 [Sphaeroforma arctica JP610]KNC74973.1 hypothetical protein SARC_12492 [Sphaeroforma arctica JP610]|eukprot:XP_014148875.1 hypothetical protein SARC_12492 [Sphaeroforma arctica JP610]